MAILGMDYMTAPSILEMKNAKIQFVCRYLASVNPATQTKMLSLKEAQAYSDANIAIVSNYEWYAERPLEGSASGAADAHIASGQHTQFGGPSNRHIYFSVDIDATYDMVAPYFRGVLTVLPLSRVGAYVWDEKLSRQLFDNKLISWAWVINRSVNDPRTNIQQYNLGTQFGGREVDLDRAFTSDYGQWYVGRDAVNPIVSNPALDKTLQDARGTVKTITTVPGLAGPIIALHNAQRFQPFSIPSDSSQYSNTPFIGGLEQAASFPARATYGVMSFALGNMLPFMIRATFAVIALIVLLALIINATSKVIKQEG